MKAIELFEPGQRYTKKQVQKILKDNGKKQVRLWPQVWGWDLYYSVEPSLATPTGAFRRTIFVNN